MSIRQACYHVLMDDLRLMNRHRGNIMNPLLFFVIVVSLFPMAVSPDASKLSLIGPGVIWVGALLSIMLSLSTLFHQEYEEGALEQLLLSPQPLALLACAKLVAHWLMTCLPLLFLIPLLTTMLSMSHATILPLFLGLLLGTPVLVMVGAIASALTLSLRSNGMLLSILILPLMIPILIFGVGAVINAELGLPFSGQLLLLLGFLVLTITLAPLTIAAALRIGVS